MPTVAVIDGIKIEFYFDEHPPPHFHAKYAEYRAVIRIDRSATQGLGRMPFGRRSGNDQMKKLPRMTKVEPVIHGVLKIVWTDGYEGVATCVRPSHAAEFFRISRSPRTSAKSHLMNTATRLAG